MLLIIPPLRSNLYRKFNDFIVYKFKIFATNFQLQGFSYYRKQDQKQFKLASTFKFSFEQAVLMFFLHMKLLKFFSILSFLFWESSTKFVLHVLVDVIKQFTSKEPKTFRTKYWMAYGPKRVLYNYQWQQFWFLKLQKVPKCTFNTF